MAQVDIVRVDPDTFYVLERGAVTMSGAKSELKREDLLAAVSV